jgi:hypothetical protein
MHAALALDGALHATPESVSRRANGSNLGSMPEEWLWMRTFKACRFSGASIPQHERVFLPFEERLLGWSSTMMNRLWMGSFKAYRFSGASIPQHERVFLPFEERTLERSPNMMTRRLGRRPRGRSRLFRQRIFLRHTTNNVIPDLIGDPLCLCRCAFALG